MYTHMPAYIHIYTYIYVFISTYTYVYIYIYNAVMSVGVHKYTKVHVCIYLYVQITYKAVYQAIMGWLLSRRIDKIIGLFCKRAL